MRVGGQVVISLRFNSIKQIRPQSFSPFRLAFCSRAFSTSTTMSLPILSSSRQPSASPLRPASSRNYDNPIAPVDGVHPVLHEGRVAAITGAGSGIGRAAAVELARYVAWP